MPLDHIPIIVDYNFRISLKDWAGDECSECKGTNSIISNCWTNQGFPPPSLTHIDICNIRCFFLKKQQKPTGRFIYYFYESD